MTNWTQQIREAYRTMLEAKEAPTYHKDPHYADIIQHNAKMHAHLGGGGETTKEHINAAQQIVTAAHASGNHHGLGVDHENGKIGGVFIEYDNLPGNVRHDIVDIEPITHKSKPFRSNKDGTVHNWGAKSFATDSYN
jgi:hypothetical protein